MRFPRFRPVLRAVLLPLLCAFLLFAPPWLLRGLSRDYIHAVFEPEPIQWRGKLELWHIVGFRTYQGSVTNHLSERTAAFSRQHPGVFIEVTGLTVEQFAERYARGERPDLYSFPNGLLYREQLRALPLDPPALRSGLSAAAADGEIFAVPYLMSGYFLLINGQRPYLSGGRAPSSPEEADLQAALQAGELAVPPVPGAQLGLTGTASTDSAAAEAAFRKGKLSYLVADARALGDLNRAADGNLLLSTLPMAGYTDQVQFLAAAAGTDDQRCAIAAELILFLLTPTEQERLAALGAMPVADGVKAVYSEPLLAGWNEAFADHPAGVPDAFLYQRHREALVQDALRAMAGEAGASDAFSERLAVVLGGQD